MVPVVGVPVPLTFETLISVNRTGVEVPGVNADVGLNTTLTTAVDPIILLSELAALNEPVDLLNEIIGIVNGTTNYILTKMNREKVDFKTVLKQA